ncbi:NAD(P)/FAD-dependent oxidoreductase [Labedaea rhizosphaerae]|uniref:NADH dehydrogenase n=1 Tax=Labedaea rhizosphaerae TaxID=598644 RepID=A0A4V3CZX4_LABRH|nr:NAD(P)/FAD-dependent oxidoreductase [Labedaea rhizosphaerae]TDQ01451.1 NADH dehydrogenase [Labedaea rhizosphaerae]
MAQRPERIVIVGGGFAGYETARGLIHDERDIEVVLINATDYFLYLPLLPEVAAGILDPQRIAISLAVVLPGVRLVRGEVTGVDLDAKTVSYLNPEDTEASLSYDKLVLAAGSVNKLLPVPGVADYAHGFRGIPEALYLRDHIIRQIELAASTDDPAERDARCTFVVVGAGYTGTEVAAQGPGFTKRLAARHPELRDQPIRWMLLDVAPHVLPELDKRLAATSDRVLRERGVDVRMKTSIDEAMADGVKLTTGERVPTRTLVWCVGVRPDPLIESIGLPTEKGRLCVDTTLQVLDHPEVFACGDVAAVPDLTRPGQVCGMTAQHAVRQGKLAGRNVLAALDGKPLRRYKHHDLGFVVDLGGKQAAANPLHVPLSGLAAKAVTRGYHLMSMPGNRLRTAIDWAVDAVSPRQSVEFGLVRGASVPLDTASPELARRR